jgi:RNA polymerase sigma factor (sigma-70 family)
VTKDGQHSLAATFEAHREHLRAVAWRLLGARAEADDAVQEAWLRFSRACAEDVDNVGGWLTTIVSRVCLNMLRSRATRREEPLAVQAVEAAAAVAPDEDAALAGAVGLALVVVLERLAPAERVAFVLHDMFDLPFDRIAPIVGRSVPATRQLASRARRRVRGATATGTDRDRQRELVDAFLAASRDGDYHALLAVLDPDVVLRADAAVVQAGGPAEVRGADDVAGTFVGRARAAKPALIDGSPGAVWAPGGRPRVVFRFTVRRGSIVVIDLVGDPDSIAGMDLVIALSRVRHPNP